MMDSLHERALKALGWDDKSITNAVYIGELSDNELIGMLTERLDNILFRWESSKYGGGFAVVGTYGSNCKLNAICEHASTRLEVLTAAVEKAREDK
jgi:hypothetical protein